MHLWQKRLTTPFTVTSNIFMCSWQILDRTEYGLSHRREQLSKEHTTSFFAKLRYASARFVFCASFCAAFPGGCAGGGALVPPAAASAATVVVVAVVAVTAVVVVMAARGAKTPPPPPSSA